MYDYGNDYDFTTHSMPLRAGRMHYVDAGNGPETIVLVHGTPTWSYEWRHVIQALSPRYRVIAPDHLGFGLSERPAGGEYTPEWHARNFEEFIERLAPGPFTLVVHDFGGPIALGLAERRPDLVRAVVVVNSWMWSFAGDREMLSRGRIAGGSIGRLLYRWANLSLRVLMPGAYGDRSKLTPGIHRAYLDRFSDRESRSMVLWPLARAIIGSGAFFEGLWRARASLASRPMLIVWGMKDSAFKPHQLKRWAAAYPDASIVKLQDAGHWPHEEDPTAVIAAIRTFLADHHDGLVHAPAAVLAAP